MTATPVEPGTRTAGGLGWPLADGVPSGGLGWPAAAAADPRVDPGAGPGAGPGTDPGAEGEEETA